MSVTYRTSQLLRTLDGHMMGLSSRSVALNIIPAIFLARASHNIVGINSYNLHVQTCPPKKF